jgi:hypothetical protein
MQTDYRDIINNVYDVIFREIYTKASYSYGKFNNYYVSRWVDDICQGKKGEDLEIKLITSQSTMYNFEEAAKVLPRLWLSNVSSTNPSGFFPDFNFAVIAQPSLLVW